MTQAPTKLSVVAPATVANVGPGFDVFGLALEGPCDRLEAWREGQEVVLESIEGDGGALPRAATENSAGIAALDALARVRARSGDEPGGLILRLHKGIPLASGLGSSAASAAAAVRAVDLLFPGVLTEEDLLLAGLAAEEVVAGRHLDNLAAALLGGFTTVVGLEPPRVRRVVPSFELALAVVTPDFGLCTADSRSALPTEVPLREMVDHLAAAVEMVQALHLGDRESFTAAIVDRVIGPVRAGKIPCCDEVLASASAAGAEAAGVSGGGPSLFAITPTRAVASRVAEAMVSAFSAGGLGASAHSTVLSPKGAHRVA
ncbi:MAG: homoserine kinase [Acidobacteriota bacterium]